MRKLNVDKKVMFQLAAQAGAAYEVAAVRGHLAVTGREPLASSQKKARKTKRQQARKARRLNRGA